MMIINIMVRNHGQTDNFEQRKNGQFYLISDKKLSASNMYNMLIYHNKQQQQIVIFENETKTIRQEMFKPCILFFFF